MLEEFAKNKEQSQLNSTTPPVKVKKEQDMAAEIKATFGEDVEVISSEEETQGSGKASGH